MTTLLEQEIFSQPQVIAGLLEKETEHVRKIIKQLPAFDYIVIAARGSSDHAALYAKYAWGALADYPVALAAPSLQTLYGHTPHFRNALVVGISQSGQSPDIVAVLEEGKRQGCPTIAITNDGASPLATTADHVVELHTGPELSVAATKTYTAQLAVMMLFTALWNNDPQYLRALQEIPQAIDVTLQQSQEIAAIAQHYVQMERCVLVGRGYNYATTSELALKLKELTYVASNAYSVADFRHGPIASVDEQVPAIIIAPGGATFDDMLSIIGELKQRNIDLLVLSDQQEALVQATQSYRLPIAVPEWLSPITTILPGQVLSWQLAVARGYNPDAPRGLNKVTKTF